MNIYFTFDFAIVDICPKLLWVSEFAQAKFVTLQFQLKYKKKLAAVFRRGVLQNELRFLTHVHIHCSNHYMQAFCLVAFSLPLSSWFAKAL